MRRAFGIVATAVLVFGALVYIPARVLAAQPCSCEAHCAGGSCSCEGAQSCRCGCSALDNPACTCV